jgi:two-component system OmpR family sensor kinase
MSLRARLLVSLGAMLVVALVVAGALLVGLTRASLVARIDSELGQAASTTTRLLRLADLTAVDSDAGRRLAVIQLDRQGNVLRAIPSGFTSDPDPLPALPSYPGGIPAGAYGTITERPSVTGSLHYRVLVEQVRPNLIVALAAPMSGVDAVTTALVRTMVLIGLIGLAVLLVVAWFVVRWDLLPLERIARTAEAIAGGDLSHRAGVRHDRTEVGRLGAAFDSMLDQVEAGFAQQQAALEAKARSEERLRRFVADASHELRTPLTAVRGYADLYHAGGLSDPAELGAAMDRIRTESRRMGSLVDDLLTLARLDQGRPTRQAPVDMSQIAGDAVSDARAVEPSRPIVGAIETGVTVTGDEDRLRQVVGNLVANVRIHSPAGSPFEVVVRRSRGLTPRAGGWPEPDARADRQPDRGAGAAHVDPGSMVEPEPDVAEIRIVDHGPGIPAEIGSSVFDRFYRADPGRSRDAGGTGLGLSIAAAIVAAHGGVIWHEATPGGGATFVVRLPLTGKSQPVPGPGPATG